MTIDDLIFEICQGSICPVYISYHNYKNEKEEPFEGCFYSLENIPEKYRKIPIVRLDISHECRTPYTPAGETTDGIFILLSGDED